MKPNDECNGSITEPSLDFKGEGQGVILSDERRTGKNEEIPIEKDINVPDEQFYKITNKENDEIAYNNNIIISFVTPH